MHYKNNNIIGIVNENIRKYKFFLSLLLLIMIIFVFIGPGVCAFDAINLNEFKNNVKTDHNGNEDWSYALQKAINTAIERSKPLLIPPGTYTISNKIVINNSTIIDQNRGERGTLYIIGSGRNISIIKQINPQADIFVWRGNDASNNVYGGGISGISFYGGRVGLDLSHHSFINVNKCYFHGMETAIICGGWSNRFSNIGIRWCRKVGFLATGHYNNNILRDCYFSRNNIGFYLEGGFGNRIESSAFEVCRLSVILRGAMSFSINNSYFEGNGLTDNPNKHFIDTPPTYGSIHLDYACTGVNISNNIFRGTKAKKDTLISISYCDKCNVNQNTFFSSNIGIGLLDKCLLGRSKAHIIRLVAYGNSFVKLNKPLSSILPNQWQKSTMLFPLDGLVK